MVLGKWKPPVLRNKVSFYESLLVQERGEVREEYFEKEADR